MTNKLKYFIGNWKMFGDFGSFKIIREINQCVWNTQNNFFFKSIFRFTTKSIYIIDNFKRTKITEHFPITNEIS